MAVRTGDDTNNILIGTDQDDQISGLGGNDFLSGGLGNDTLEGGSGSDVLSGGAGIDTMNGGTGVDTFQDTAANLNGDIIQDFNIGDRIQITDLNKDTAGIGISGNLLTYNGGSVEIDNLGPGRFAIRQIEGGGVEVRLQESAHNDFNGDGFSDLLWRNDDGTVREWLGQMDGSFAGNIAHVDVNPGLGWHVAGTGDFDGDGRVDILWRNDSGTVQEWLGQPDGSFASNIDHVDVNPGLGWHIQGTGDFNGDGRSDILWRNDQGTLREWLGQPDGSFAGNITYVDITPDVSWHVAGTGDFNGDGHDDILWRNDNGTVQEWLGQDSGGFADNAAVNVNPGVGWQIAGTGDFNGDGRSDILWRGNDGTVREWLSQSDGTFAGNIAHVDVNPGTGWHVAAIGDFNGDIIDDVLWRSDDGSVREWLGQTNGGFVDNIAHVDVNPGTGWHVQEPFVHDPFA